MVTQWPADAELKNEISNLCEQTRVAKQNGFSSIMVGRIFSEPRNDTGRASSSTTGG